jgi:signal transduction histidine kinase
MKMDFLQFFKTKRVFITLGLLAATFLVSEYSLQTSTKVKILSNLKEGINTCFGRVSQTYTAKMMNDSGSDYLTKSFMTSTEECFGDAISMMEEKFEYALAGTFKLVNTISSDVHWFHEKLTNESAEKLIGSDVIVTNFGARFSTIENSRFTVIDGMEQFNSLLDSKVRYLRFGFWALIAMTIAFMLFEVLSKKQTELMADYYEDQAKELNNQFNPLSINKVQELISASLENSKLSQLNLLIKHVGLQGTEERTSEEKEYIAPRSFNTGLKQQNIEQEIDNAWEMGEVATDNKVRTSELNTQYENIFADKLDTIHLDNTLAKVVSLISSRLFTRGIVLEFDIDEELYVYAEEESLEQVFYHVFTNAFKDLENRPGIKKIKVSVRSLGGSLLLSFEDNGLSFSKEFMKKESGLIGIESEAITVSTELEICRMFMNDFGGSVLFENAFDSDRKPVGKKVKLVFKTARKPLEIGLSMVKKTTKKEFIAELENKLS